jgi:hypothetical protein
MRKIILKSVSFRLFSKKMRSIPWGAEAKGKPEPLERKTRSHNLVCLKLRIWLGNGNNAIKWDAGPEFVRGVFFQGTGAALIAAAIAAFVCIAHNRNSSTQNVKRFTTVYWARLEPLRPYFMSPSDI